MSTWFTAVLGQLPDVLFDIRIEDQDHSARLLREGAVMGAVTTERTPVSGCRVQSLGVMRYVPVASGEYVKFYLPEGSPQPLLRRLRRWPGIVPMRYRTCWCAELFAAPLSGPFTTSPQSRGVRGGCARRIGVGHVPGAVGHGSVGRPLVRADLRRAP
jgi:hypothetical protein